MQSRPDSLNSTADETISDFNVDWINELFFEKDDSSLSDYYELQHNLKDDVFNALLAQEKEIEPVPSVFNSREPLDYDASSSSLSLSLRDASLPKLKKRKLSKAPSKPGDDDSLRKAIHMEPLTPSVMHITSSTSFSFFEVYQTIDRLKKPKPAAKALGCTSTVLKAYLHQCGTSFEAVYLMSESEAAKYEHMNSLKKRKFVLTKTKAMTNDANQKKQRARKRQKRQATSNTPQALPPFNPFAINLAQNEAAFQAFSHSCFSFFHPLQHENKSILQAKVNASSLNSKQNLSK